MKSIKHRREPVNYLPVNAQVKRAEQYVTLVSDDRIMFCGFLSDDRFATVGSRSTGFPGDHDDDWNTTSGGDDEILTQVCLLSTQHCLM